MAGTGYVAAFEAPMRLALAEAAAAGADVPVGAVVLDAGRGRHRPWPQPPGGHRRPHRARRGRGDPRRRRGCRRLAPGRLHAGGHAGTVHDVRRARSRWPGWRGSCTAPTTPRAGRPDRCGTCSATAVSVTCRKSSGESWGTSAAPSYGTFLPRAEPGHSDRVLRTNGFQPPGLRSTDGGSVGRRRRSVPATHPTHRLRPSEIYREFFASPGCHLRSAMRVSSPAVESPSGRGRTPRKRVRGQPLRGFKSHLHRHCLAGLVSAGLAWLAGTAPP